MISIEKYTSSLKKTWDDFVEKSKDTQPAPEDTKVKVRSFLNKLRPSDD